MQIFNYNMLAFSPNILVFNSNMIVFMFSMLAYDCNMMLFIRKLLAFSCNMLLFNCNMQVLNCIKPASEQNWVTDRWPTYWHMVPWTCRVTSPRSPSCMRWSSSDLTEDRNEKIQTADLLLTLEHRHRMIRTWLPGSLFFCVFSVSVVVCPCGVSVTVTIVSLTKQISKLNRMGNKRICSSSSLGLTYAF